MTPRDVDQLTVHEYDALSAALDEYARQLRQTEAQLKAQQQQMRR